MLDNLKKFWFVVLVGAIALVGIGFYAVDQMNSIFRGKKVDGVSVIASANNQNLLIDRYYDLLFNEQGENGLYSLFERAVLSEIPTSDEIRAKAKEYAEAVIANYSQNGTEGLKQLDLILISLGYSGRDELTLYFENMEKRNDLARNYLLETDTENLAQNYIDTYMSRTVSHILVKMDDPENPTDENQKKITAIEEALASGTEFSTVAAQYSDDSGSAVNGGLIGYIDANDQNFVAEFRKGALALTEEKEVSEWVKSSYGWHLIRLDSKSLDVLIKEDAFLEAVVNQKPAILFTTVWEKAQAFNVSFGSDEVKESILNTMGIEVDE